MAKCKDCGVEFGEVATDPESRIPCPRCGSKRRIGTANGALIVPAPKMQMKFHVRSLGWQQKKPSKEFVIGDEQHRKSGKWFEKTRIVNREDDRYVEIVKDPKTGDVIRRCIERLSEHQGHGSDQKQRNPEKNERPKDLLPGEDTP